MHFYGRYVIFALAFFFLHVSATCDEPVYRVRIESGGIIPFHINSMLKYSEGQRLSDWTILSFFVNNFPDAVLWEVEVSTSGSVFSGDYGNTLPTETLIIKAYEMTPSIPGLYFHEIVNISNTPQTLLEGTGNGNFFIAITYELGTNEEYALLGKNPDYYFSELHFVLKIIN